MRVSLAPDSTPQFPSPANPQLSRCELVRSPPPFPCTSISIPDKRERKSFRDRTPFVTDKARAAEPPWRAGHNQTSTERRERRTASTAFTCHLAHRTPQQSPMSLSDEQMMDNVHETTYAKPKKSVRFATVEVLEFRVGYTSCAVPSAGGPPVGLIRAPIAKYVRSLEQSDEEIEEEDQRPRRDINEVWLCPVERALLLTHMYGFTPDEIALLCHEVRSIHDSRLVSRLDFDVAYALHVGDLSKLQKLRELQYTTAPESAPPRAKIMLFESNDRVGILA